MNYWEESLSEILAEAGVKFTSEQLKTIASDVELSASAERDYRETPRQGASPLKEENERLKKELRNEKDKRVCERCKGYGYTVTNGGSFSSSSSCFDCNGDGRL